MNSVIKRDRADMCFLCGYNRDIEEHHIFGGANRKKSEKYGLKVHLCHRCHNEPPAGVHHNAEMMRLLRSMGERIWLNEYGKTIDDFISEFGKNYIEDD